MNKPPSTVSSRDLVVVSGYYGFDNLGDEAILEELTTELKQVVSPSNIVVLSANPEETAAKMGTRSLFRMEILPLIQHLQRAQLFISGGGGLFQNTKTVGSVLYYGMQVMLAKTLGAQVMIYAQGIGPLNGKLAEWITKQAFSVADVVAVRDANSKELLDSWNIDSILTADPVWCLEAKPLPDDIEQQLRALPTGKLIGLSLRESHNFTDAHLDAFVGAMLATAPDNAHVLLLALQAEQDRNVLQQFATQWRAAGRECTALNTDSLKYPSQWITLLGRCQVVVAMRLHALIMALKAGVAVAGLAYDPKVSSVLAEFEQPILILAKDFSASDWTASLQTAFVYRDRLSRRAIKRAESAKKMACQNFRLIARILDAQKHS